MYANLEEQVRDAMAGGPCGAALSALIDMTATSVIEKRPIFDSVASEPVFYRKHFKQWVGAVIDEERAIYQADAGAMRAIGI